MLRSRRSALLLAGILGLSLLSCGREVTGPENGLFFGRDRIAALALAPEFPRIPGANAISDLVPFERVRITLRRADGTIARDTLVSFPSTADSVALAIDVPLPMTAPDSGITLNLSLAYLNAAGDTVFRGGPLPVTARSRRSPANVPISIPVNWVPPGGVVPASVSLTPESGTAVAGTTTTFSAEARDAQGQPIPGTPIFFSSEDTLRARVASVGSGLVTWLPVRGTTRIIATLPNGPADTSAFEVSLPASLLLLVSGDGQSATINTALAQPVSFRVVASDSVPVAGMPVTFAVTAGGGTLGALADTSDATGLVTTSWTLGALVGAQTVTATVTGVPAATRAVTATGLAPVPTQLAITAAPTTAVAGATFAPVTVEVRDADGVLTPLFTGPVSLALDAATAAGATLGGTTTVNAVAGIATFSDLSVSRVSTGLLLVATSAGLAPDTSAALDITTAPASLVASVSGGGQSGAVLTALAAPFVVRVTDAFGNPVSGTIVDWAVTGGVGTVSAPSTTTNAAGEASTTLTLGGTIGSVTVSATAAGLAGSPVLFTATSIAGAPAQLFFSQSITSATAGSVNEWIVQVRDAAGNVATGFNGPVSVALIDGPPTAVLGGTTTVNAVNGFANFNTLTVDLAATTYRLVASSAGLPDLPSVPFIITPAAASALALVSGDAQTAVIATTLSQPFLVRVTDAFTNPVAGVTVAWAITSGGGALSAPTAVTDALGNASVTLTTGVVAGASTVTATVAGLTGSPVTFTSTVTAGAAASLAITSGPIGPQVAGVPLANVVVEARDAGANLVPSFTGLVIARTEQGGVAVDSAQAVAVAGVATFIGASFETAGTYSIRFSAAGLTDAQSDTFVVSPAAAVQLALQSGDAQSGTVGQLLPAPLVVRTSDAFDNGVGGVTVRWAMVRGGDTLAALDVASDATGSAAYQPTLPDSAGPLQFVARATGLAGSPVIATATVNPGAATQLAIITAPTSGVVSTALPTSTIHVLDALGNLVTTFTGDVGAQVDSGPVGGTLAGNTPIAAVAGVASFTNIGVAVVGTYRLRFTSAGLTDAVSANFDVTPGAPTQLVFVQQTAAGTAGAALAPGFTVEARDAGNNLVTTFTGAVTVGLGGGNPLALLGGTTSVPAIAGVASFADLTVDLASTGYTLTASADALGGATSAAFTIAAAAPATMTLIAGDAQTGSVSAVLADSIAFRVSDAFGNVVPNAGWTIAVTGGGGSASPAGGNADAAGEFRTSWTLGAALGPQSINAFVTAQPTILATATATAVAGSPTQLVITSAPFGTLTAGATAPDLVLEARDAGGNLATSFTGTVWGRVNTGPVIGNDSAGVAAVGGVATFSGAVYDRAGTYTLRFNADGLTDAISPSFDVVAGAPAAIAPDTLAPGGGQTGIVGAPIAQPLRVLVTDAFGNGAGGVLVTFTAVRGADTLGIGTAVSDAAGLVSYTPTLPTSAGPLAYLVTADGLTGSGFSLAATADPGAPTQLAIAQQPDTVAAASIIGGIVVQARDTFGNATPGFADVISVQILAGPAGATLGGTTSLAADGGEATFSTLTLDLAGSYQLEFTSGTLAAAVPLLTVIPGAPASLVAVAGAGQTGPINAELPDSLAVRVTDLGGNPITGVATNWAVTAGGGTISAAVATTGADGIARVAWTLGPLAGSQQVDVEAPDVGSAAFTATGTTVSLTWSGGASDAWTDPLNWVEGRAPLATDSLTIPNTGFTFAPRITASTFVRSLVNLSESPITVDGAIVLQVTERLNVRSDAIGVSCPTGSLDMGTVGGSAVLRGRVDCDLRGIASTVTLDGETYVGGGRGGSTQFDSRLVVNGQRLTVEGGFFTFNTSRLDMTNPADTVTFDNVSFQGASTAGSLTEGLMSVRGTLDAQTAGGFTAGGNHRTRFVAGIGDTVTVSTSVGAARFGAVEFARPVRLAGEFTTEGEAFVNYGGAVVGATGRLDIGGSLVGTTGTLVAPRAIALAGVLADTGVFRPDTTIFTGTGQVMPFRVGAAAVPQYQAVRIEGSVSADFTGGIDSIAGPLDIPGVFAATDVSQPADLRIAGDLRVSGGRFLMNTLPHLVTVYGSALFDGGDAEGDLADGTLTIYGALAQGASITGRSFRPLPRFTVRLEGDGGVTFADPAQSHFGRLEVGASGVTRTFLSDARVTGVLRLVADGGATFSSDVLGAGGTRQLTAEGLDQGGTFAFRNVALRLQGDSVVSMNSTLSFGDFDPAAVQWEIARDSGTIQVFDPVFTSTPTGAGRYLRVQDTDAADGLDLSVVVNGVPTPAVHGGFAEAVAPAILTGWAASPSFTWTGAAGTSAWSTPANWLGGVVPGVADSVTIPSTLTAPLIPDGTTLRALVSTRTESPVALAGTLGITERLRVPTQSGLSCSVGTVEFTSATAKAAAGRLDGCLVRVLGGSLTASDTLEVINADLQVESDALFDVGGQEVTVGFTFSTLQAGRLQMQAAGGRLRVFGGVTFDGGSTAGLLTAGELSVGGNFTQGNATDPESFAAGGTHETIFSTEGAQQVVFATPGQAAGTSHFQHLRISQAPGSQVLLNSEVYANGQLREDMPTNAFIGTADFWTLYSAGADVAGVDFERVRWEVLDGDLITRLDSVAFGVMPATVPQFGITRTSGSYGATGFSFATTPTAGGSYVRLVDPDDVANGALTLTMTGTSPSAHGGLVDIVAPAELFGWGVNPPAGVISWTGAADGTTWENQGNWSLPRTPIATDSVVVDGTAAITLASPATVAWLTFTEGGTKSFAMNSGAVLQVDSIAVFGTSTTVALNAGGTLTGEGGALILGQLDWNAGTMAGVGGTVVAGGATATIGATGTPFFNERVLSVGGTAVMGATSPGITGTPAISVTTGGVLEFATATSYFQGGVGNELSILNQGTVRAATGGTVRIDWPIQNLGVLEVASGTLDLRNALTHVAPGSIDIQPGAALVHGGETNATAAVTVGAGGRLELSSGGISANAGNHLFAPGSSISGLGRLAINSADTTRIEGALDIDSLTVQNGDTWFDGPDTMFVTRGAYLGGGFLRGSGVIGIRGDFVLNPGNIVGTGTMAVRPGGTLALFSMTGWQVDVAGTAYWRDYDMVFEQDTLNSVPYSSVRVRSGGLFEIQHGTTTPRQIFARGATTGQVSTIAIDAGGVLRKSSGTGVSNIRSRVEVAGLIDVQAGSINIQGSCAVLGGSLTTSGGGTLTGDFSPTGGCTFPSNLVFTGGALDGAEAGDLLDPITVEVRNSSGTVLTSYNGPVTLSFAQNPTSTVLLGTTTVQAVNGVATFNEVSVGLPGAGYQLTPSAGSIPGSASASFSVLDPTVPPDSTSLAANGSGAYCAIDIAGTAHCWGSNGQGELGSGDNARRLSPSPVTGGISFQSLTAGNGHTCGIAATGDAYCWGRNTFGALGDNSTANSSLPVLVQGGHTWRALDAGSITTCGLTVSGQAYCWGSNSGGRIGDGTETNRLTPTPVSSPVRFTRIVLGAFSSCGLTAAGFAYCWGINNGSFGNGSTANSLLPTPAGGGARYATLSVGDVAGQIGALACGVTVAGENRCWGTNTSGGFANGGAGETALSPVPGLSGLAPTRLSMLEGGRGCATESSGNGYCWGANAGTLGNGTFFADATTPALVGGGSPFNAIAPGASSTCGITSGGGARCWGVNNPTALGDGGAEFALAPTALPFLADGARLELDLFSSLACARDPGGLASCWGINVEGGAGSGSTADFIALPQAVSGGHTFAELALGVTSCGVDTGGTLRCWGRATDFQFGFPSASSNVPVAVPSALQFTSVSRGNGHGCALAVDGSAHCWGLNAAGQLGRGTTSTSEPLDAVVGGLTFDELGLGNQHACGRAGTAVYCWGSNSTFSIGDGSTATPPRTGPSLVAGGNLAQALFVGGQHSCILRTDGEARCWGNGGAGQLGNAGNASLATPVAPSGGLTFTQLALGNNHTCGLTAGGAAYCWGLNFNGQLGDGTFTNSNVPTLVAGAPAFVSIRAGLDLTCGTTASDETYCWGRRYGRFGSLPAMTPQPVVGGITFRTPSP